jgi:hypothetical protein
MKASIGAPERRATMFSKILKSIRAFVAATVAVFVLSFGTDFLLQAMGLPILKLNYASGPLIVAIIVYRNAYNVLGGYIIARLAPARPVGHALAIGTLGLVGALVATIATWNMNVGPAWYSLSIAVLALPSSWAGGKLFVSSRRVLHAPRGESAYAGI